ncbi:hypothetical protein Tco_1154456 [Tanacetum coccineum]
MGHGTWYYSLGVSSIVDAFVRSEFGVSSWRGSRVDGRSYLLSGAIDGSEVNEIIQNPKWELESSCFTFDLVPLVVRSVCIAWIQVGNIRADLGIAEGARRVRSLLCKRDTRTWKHAWKKRKDYVNKTLEKCRLESMEWKLFSECVFFEGHSTSGKGKDMESGSYWLDKVWTSIWRDVRTLAIEEAYTTKYSIHPGADTMLCGFRLTNRWLSNERRYSFVAAHGMERNVGYPFYGYKLERVEVIEGRGLPWRGVYVWKEDQVRSRSERGQSLIVRDICEVFVDLKLAIRSLERSILVDIVLKVPSSTGIGVLDPSQ